MTKRVKLSRWALERMAERKQRPGANGVLTADSVGEIVGECRTPNMVRIKWPEYTKHVSWQKRWVVFLSDPQEKPMLTNEQIILAFTKVLGHPPRSADLVVVMSGSVDDLAEYLWDHWMGGPNEPTLADVKAQVEKALEP